MTSEPLGSGPQEPEGEPDRTGGGWIPPEDRLWRHPSELSSWHQPAPHTTRPAHRRGATAMVGTVAVAAVAVGLLLLVSAGGGTAPVEVGTVSVSTAAVTQCCRLPASLAQDAEESMVSIESANGSRLLGCGVVLGDGNLVATSTAALGTARRVRAVAATGRTLTATVVGTDPTSGVAVLALPTSLPAAPVGSSTDVGTGSPAMTVAVAGTTTSNRAEPRPQWTSGTVVALDASVPSWGGSSMAAIVVRGASVPEMPGEPLVGQDGKVVGILTGSTGEMRAFLPMDVVTTVSDDIDTMGHVRHGWLDLSVTTLTGTSGAAVMAVNPQGASTGVLAPGDVIVALDGTPVSSSTALRSALYVLPPGSRVTVEVLRGGQLLSAVVHLSASP